MRLRKGVQYMQKHDCEKANCVQRTSELVLLEHKVRNEYHGK